MHRVVLLLLSLLLVAQQENVSASDDFELGWVTSGGGWRAMASSVGCANAFWRAGLLKRWKSKFSAITVSSGSAWFGTQFFYSQNFFLEVVKQKPGRLEKFVTRWMESYLDLQKSVPRNPLCEAPDGLIKLFVLPLEPEDLIDACSLIVSYGGDWRVLIETMLLAASTAYNDADFINRSFNSSGRVLPLRNTNLFVAASLAPVSRARTSPNPADDILVYLSPSGTTSSTELYAVSLTAQFAIKGNSYSFTTTGSPETWSGPAPLSFDFEDYKDYYLFPGLNGDVLTNVSVASSRSSFASPFGGAPSIVQVAAASSAAAADGSGAVPSVLAQSASRSRFLIDNSGLPPDLLAAQQALLEGGLNSAYQLPLFDGLAVCSQSPVNCGSRDGRLTDGGYTDGIGLALTILQFQKKTHASKTLKFIITDNKVAGASNSWLLSYFSTTFNQGVAPGDFIWLPVIVSGQPAQENPQQSPQVFQDYMDDEVLAASQIAIPGLTMTYAFINCTTLDNPAFGIESGQPVELLVLFVNSDIPTRLFGRNITATHIEPLARLTADIANSAELVNLVKTFASSV